jgi:cell filamentation protein
LTFPQKQTACSGSTLTATSVQKNWTAPSTNILTANMDPYVYPGTSVIRNLRDIRDAGVLGEFEAEATARRLRQLEHKPIKGRFDARHLQAIHRHIFQDVFEWAGEFRTVNISKSGDPFAFHQHIVSSLERMCGQLNREGNLLGLNPELFAARAAYYLGEINAIHPFREGNGRTQREFIRELGLHNGLLLDWRQISQEEMIEASRRSLRVDNSGLEQLLKKGADIHQPALATLAIGTSNSTLVPALVEEITRLLLLP